MFRNSLRRCASSARSATSATILSQTRSTLPIVNRRIAPVLSSIKPLGRIASIRAYSSEVSEATANQVEESAADTPAAAPKNETAKFSDLEGVHPNLLSGITSGFGYDSMTPVQAKTIKPALKGTDIVAQAKTGTGKTLAFLLPLLQRMLVEDPSLANRESRRRARSDDIRGIVMSPTRELAEQIAVEARRLCKNTGLVVQCAVGGTDKRSMLNRTRREGCHLLVATPGRLNDLLQDPRSGIDAPNLAALVLDEADRMLDVGFEKELNEITRCLPSVDEKVRQTMLVSATIPDNVIRLARSMVRANDFEFVQTISETESLTHDKVPQNITPVSSWTNVFPSLFELIDREVAKSLSEDNARPFKAIVYFNTTSLVELAGELGYERRRARGRDSNDAPVFVMQSKLSQQQRQKAADMFRSAKKGILFSSDVTARGMDFPDVTHVIQVDTPRDRESYIHRLGRTGRQGKEGEGWLIIPHTSISSARRMLQGLPIKQNNSLESAEIDVVAGESTSSHQELKGLFGVMPRSLLASTYTSMFGNAADKLAVAEDANDWALHGWGWESPPSVSKRWVQLMGLGRAQGMNISDERQSRFRSGDRSDRSDRPERSDRGSRFNKESRDPFDAMRRGVVRDDFRGRSSGSRSRFRPRDDQDSF
ncbi:P-loop containing nucleoside triphosphate hydrolase protein [Mariannaea sp. PMI_226]|nr:P-loop containing nucleoside triphosphate hydrolase protein [Mariannaea sp. PMI_226]